MKSLLIVFSVLAGSAKSLCSKGLHSVNSNRFGLSLSNVIIFSAALVAVLVLALIYGFGGLSGFSATMGILYACALTAGQLLYMSALSRGPVSVTAFIYSCGFLVPTVAGVFFWHENITMYKAVGTLLLLVSFFLIAYTPGNNDGQKSGGAIWRICAFSAMAMSGILGILQKAHQTSVHSGELGSFLTVAMTGSIVLSVLLAFLARAEQTEICYAGKFAAIAVVCGLFYGMANFINVKLAGVIPATIQFPLVNGGTIVFTAVMGRILFKEHLSWMKRIGIMIGILAIYIFSRQS